MDFLEQIGTYEFLTEETTQLLTKAYQQEMLSEKEQADIIQKCENTKAVLMQQEVELLQVLAEEERALLHESNTLTRHIHEAEERFDRTQEDDEINQLESQF